MLKESKDEFEWVIDILNNTISYGKVYRCQHSGKDVWDLEIMITDVDLSAHKIDNQIMYVSRVGKNTPDNRLHYNNKVGNTTFEYAQKTINDGYWKEIQKKESLFKNDTI